MKVRIGTWNIGGAKPIRSIDDFSFRDEDYLEEDTTYFASKIRELDLDIVCLQETHVNAMRSVAKEIGELAGGYHCSEVGLSESHIDGTYLLGNAILSKQKPQTEHVYVLPYPDFPLTLPNGDAPKEHKKAIQLLTYPFGNIANTHLQPLRFLGTPYDSENGLRYAKEIEEEFKKHLHTPLILCGDFNYGAAEKLYGEVVAELKLVNVLPSLPTRPDGKITDYVFVTPNFSVSTTGILKTQSDHFLCWAELETGDSI